MQYLSIRNTERLAEAGAVISVGSHGDALDNALAETIKGLFEPIGHIPPAEFEEMFCREQTLIEHEGLKQVSLH